MDNQNLGKDIRDTLDLTQNKAEIRRYLQLHRPPGQQYGSGPNDFDTRGLDCLIALIRHIYSQILPVYFDKEEHKEAEEKNPVLALAWLDINFEDKIAWADCKQHVLKVLSPSQEGTLETSFVSLVNSPLMKETFWNHEVHILYRACLEQPTDAPWGHADLGPNAAAAMVDMSTIVVDRNLEPEWSFRRYMRSYFKIVKKRNKRELCMCAEPCIIRVHYKTNKDLEPFPFSTLKNVNIPIAEIKDSEPIPDDRDCLYTLVASVSLKEQRIRTYAFLGEEIMPWPSSGKGNKRSLEDRIDGDFMLFYCRAGDAMPDFGIAETVHLPRDRPTFSFLNKFFDEGIKEKKEEERV
jgi:hypothetical protein